MKNFLLAFIFCSLSYSIAVAQNYSTHKVKEGETIEQIAKRYLVTPFEIFRLNPDSKKELRVGSVLIIPKSTIKSKEVATVTKELKGFVEHKVKRKETLYSISKKYDVEIDEIKKHNPRLYGSDLKKGEKIKIPQYTKTLVISKPKAATKKYSVLPKEGKWRIAYKYGITIEELEALNPGLGETLQEGQQINVPNLEVEEEKQVDDSYSYYTVLPKEGFYRLKLKLGLEQDELEALNPELKDGGLKSGMVLKIPFSAVKDSTQVTTESSKLESKLPRNPDMKRLAVMLPFRLNKVELDSLEDTKKQILKDPYLNNSLDFYSGVLVALDSLKTLGASLHVDVFDTKNEKSEIASILRTQNLDSVDAVIGPLMTDNFKIVASELRSAKVPIISPVGKNLDLLENVFQSRPSDEALQIALIEHVKRAKTDGHIIIISDSEHATVRDLLKRQFPAASLVNSRKNKSGKDMNYVTLQDIEGVLREGKNYVFMETESSSFVSNVTSILNSKQSEETQIVMLSTNFNRAFEADEISNYNLSNLQFTYSTTARSNTEEGSNSFVRAYTKRFGETPSKMATRGFDITMDVVLRLLTSDTLYESAREDQLTQYVENKFSYKKKLFGGYYNDSVYLVKYDNLRIVEVTE